MRTTLAIDDDVLGAARALARREKVSLGKAVSQLARAGLTGPAGASVASDGSGSFYGFRPLPARPGVVVTDALVDDLRQEDPP